MLKATVFAFAILVAAWVVYRRQLPGGVELRAAYRDYDPCVYDLATNAAVRFEKERQKRVASIRTLEKERFLFEKYGRELRHALPNDAETLATYDADLRSSLDSLNVHVQLARKRQPGAELTFPVPLDQEYFVSV